MRITQISTRYWPYAAGLEQFLNSLSKELADNGNDLTIMTTNSSGEYSIPQLRLGTFPINAHTLPFPAGTSRLGSNYRIQRFKAYFRFGPIHFTNIFWSSKQKTDILNVHVLADLPFLLSAISKNPNSKRIITIHDVVPTVASKYEKYFWNPYSKFVIPKLLERFHHIIVPSLSQLSYLKEIGVESEKISLVPLCFDPQVELVAQSKEDNCRSKIRMKYNVDSCDFLIISIGRLIKVKRYDLVLKAISEILKKKPNQKIKFMIVGADEGDLDRLKQYIHNLELSHETIFLGKKSHNETLQILKAADLFVMPSDDEAFNLATIEAMRLSVPVLVSSGVGARYLINNDGNGVIFEKDNVEDLTNKLLKIIENPNKLFSLGAEGSKTAAENCSPKAVAQQYTRIYRSALYDF